MGLLRAALGDVLKKTFRANHCVTSWVLLDKYLLVFTLY